MPGVQKEKAEQRWKKECKEKKSMSEIKLKPCPFCGGEAQFITESYKSSHYDAGFNFTIQCQGCYTRLPQEYSLSVKLDAEGCIIITGDGRKDAAAAWNRRADNEID